MAEENRELMPDYYGFPDHPGYILRDFQIALKEYSYSETTNSNRTPKALNEMVWVRVMEGEICFEIDGNTVFIGAGETMFINSRHLIAFRGVQTAPAKFRLVLAMPQAVSVPAIDAKIRRMNADDSFSSTVIRPVSQLFSYDLDALFDLYSHRPDAWEFEIASHYLSMLRQIWRIYQHANPDDVISRNVDLESLREMLSYIGENYRDEITVDQIAAAGKMSRSRCTRLFRRYLQESPIEHVQKYRLEKSIYLIKNSDLQFAEIAAKCGFNQQSYFNRLFVREYGKTPKQMRMESMLSRTRLQGR